MYSLFKLGELHVAKCRLLTFREGGDLRLTGYRNREPMNTGKPHE
jgi:hypothetical protein